MVKVDFSEEQYIENNKKTSRKFGFGSKELREEYLDLCKQLLGDASDAENMEDIRNIRKRVIEIMTNTARDHINTKISDVYKGKMLETLDEIVENTSQPPYDFGISDIIMVNIVAFQLALLFTYFPLLTVELPENPKKNKSWLSELLKQLDRSGMGMNRLINELTGRYYNYAIFPSIRDGSWKNYTSILEKGLRNFYNGILSRVENGRFIPMIGFSKLKEIVEGIIDDIHFIGLAFVDQDVDGEVQSPVDYFSHDIGHYIDFLETFEKVDISDIRHHLKQFRIQLREKTNDPSILYSVDFILFHLLHEQPQGFSYDNFYIELDVGIDAHVDAERCMNMRDLGLSIPRQFRNPLPNDPNTLDIDDVREYISLAWERFRDVWREYKETNQLNFGFRAINKKSKKRDKNKKSKKRDKSKNKKLKRSTTKIVKKRLTKRSIKKRSAKKSKTKRSIGKKK